MLKQTQNELSLKPKMILPPSVGFEEKSASSSDFMLSGLVCMVLYSLEMPNFGGVILIIPADYYLLFSPVTKINA